MNEESHTEYLFSNKQKGKPTNSTISSKLHLVEKKIKHENYPKIPLLEIATRQQFCLDSNIPIKKIVIQTFKRFENLSLAFEERKKLWLLITHSSQNLKENEGLYQDILMVLQNYPKNFSRLIELDVTRTFKSIITPKDSFSSNSELLENLREVLNCYSCRNPYIGYCQGLNFIAGELLKQGFSNEEAFWVFSYILEVALPVDYYTSMISLMVDQRVFAELLSLHLCELSDKFKELGLETSVFSLQWFVCLFSCTVGSELLRIIWDFMLVKGHFIFHKIGITLLLLIQNDLMKAQDFGFLYRFFYNKLISLIGELLLILEEKIKEIKDLRLFQKTLLDLKIPKKMIQELALKHYVQIKKEMETRIKSSKEQNISVSAGISRDSSQLKKSGSILEEKCNPTSPICMKTLEKNKMRKKKQSFLVYRQGFSPYIIPNYLENLDKIKNDNHTPLIIPKKTSEEIDNEETLKLMQKPENSVLIGRVHHICFKKQLASRQVRKKEDHFNLEGANFSHDEKSLSALEKDSKNQRSSSLNKSKQKEGFPKKKDKKFSEKVNKSKDFFVNLFKGSFCMTHKEQNYSPNVDFKPRVLDFDSFLTRAKPKQGKKESIIIADAKKQEFFENKNFEIQTHGEAFYENGLGLTTLSPLLNSNFYDKLREKLDRSNSISFNKKFLGGT